MASDIPDGVQKYLSGLDSQEAPQSSMKPGDPQLAALAQYLEGKLSVDPRRVIVDFGSGKGICALVMEALWQSRQVPFYVAVDLPGPLAALSLPPNIHNRSRKISVDSFYHTELRERASQVAAVVIRNVLHELDISQTALLFSTLCRHLPSEAEIYIQDMSNLPRAERGRAGWLPEVLSNVLNNLGLAATYFSQDSFGGTNWFALTVKPQPLSLSESAIGDAIADGRRAQQEELARLLAELVDVTDADSARITRLNFDIGSIAAQLHRYRRSALVPAALQASASVPVPTVSRDTFGPYDYAEPIVGTATERSGLGAILSNKRLLDFPALLAAAKSRILLMGYSQRSLFRDARNLEALAVAVRQGATVRILLASPDGPATKLRSSESVYSGPAELAEDIRYTLDGARQFSHHISLELGAASGTAFAVRLFEGVPHASYVVVDDACFVSLYSRHLSGSRGVCLVFQHTASAPTGYFDVLLQDFEQTWHHSAPLTLS